MWHVWNISIFFLKATRAISFGWGSNFSLCHERGDQSWRGLTVWSDRVFPYADYALSILGFHLRLVRSINISCITCKTLQRDRWCKVTSQVSVFLHKKWSNPNDPSQGDLELRGVRWEIENRGWITRSHLLPGWSPVFDRVVLYVCITIRKFCFNQESQQSIYSVQRRPSRCMALRVGMVGNLF